MGTSVPRLGGPRRFPLPLPGSRGGKGKGTIPGDAAVAEAVLSPSLFLDNLVPAPQEGAGSPTVRSPKQEGFGGGGQR